MMRTFTLVVGIGLMTLNPISWAAQVSQVKGKSLLIETEGEPMKPGDVFFAMDLSGKRKGIVTIGRIRGTKAIGKLTKGQAEVGMSLVKRGSVATRQRPTETASYSQSSSSNHRMYWGGMVGVASDSMKADIETDTGVKLGTASTTGIGFSAMGLFDYQVFDQVWFRGLGGVESFKTSGDNNCGDAGNQACDVNLMFLSFTPIARYVFTNGQIRPWLGAGVALLFPISKDTTLLRESTISSTWALLATGGLDWHLNSNMYIPISVEYGLFPKSDTVETSWIQGRVGVAVPF